MGNHVAGRAMGLAAEMAVLTRSPTHKALDLLDMICNRYRRCDAEWEAEDPNDPSRVHPDFEFYTDPHRKAALGMLMVEAFAPGGLESLPEYEWGDGDEQAEEAKYDRWYADVMTPFKARYEFC